MPAPPAGTRFHVVSTPPPRPAGRRGRPGSSCQTRRTPITADRIAQCPRAGALHPSRRGDRGRAPMPPRPRSPGCVLQPRDGVGVMIGERQPHADQLGAPAGFANRGEEFFRPPDAGETQHGPAGKIGRRFQDCKSACSTGIRPEARSRRRCGRRRSAPRPGSAPPPPPPVPAQRPGRDHAAVLPNPAAPSTAHQERSIFLRREGFCRPSSITSTRAPAAIAARAPAARSAAQRRSAPARASSRASSPTSCQRRRAPWRRTCTDSVMPPAVAAGQEPELRRRAPTKPRAEIQRRAWSCPAAAHGSLR